MNKDQRGIAVALEILLAVVILGGIGFAGYRVMQAKNTDTDSSSAAKTTVANEATEASWQKGDVAVSGKFADADIIDLGDGTFRMYYASQPEGGKLEVYSATSKDGKTWAQESGVRKTMVTFPDVVKTTEGKYRMYFQSAGVIKSAISDDGLTFKDESGTRVDTSNSENLTFDNVAAPSVMVQKGGGYMMVYRGTVNEKYDAGVMTPNQTTQLLMWATSDDGLTFTKKGIAVDSRNETLAGQLDGPDLVEGVDGSIKIYATSYTGVYEFDFEEGKSSTGTLVFAAGAKRDDKGFTGQPPGDPSIAKIGDTWYMYYGQTGTETGIHYATLSEY